MTAKSDLTKYVNKRASIEKNALTPKKFFDIIEEMKKATETFKNDPVLLEKYLEIFSINPEKKFIIVIAPCHS